MNEQAIRTLKSLVQLDVDAFFAYTQAIERIDDAAIRARLEAFRGDHERHITDLSQCMRDAGAEPPARTRDFKGFMISGFTALRSMTGVEGALKAMESNEETTNQHYREALTVAFTPAVRAVVERNYEDERRHLAYVKEALAARSWEHAAARP